MFVSRVAQNEHLFEAFGFTLGASGEHLGTHWDPGGPKVPRKVTWKSHPRWLLVLILRVGGRMEGKGEGGGEANEASGK